MMEIFIIFWIICSVIFYGFSFGYFQREFKSFAEEGYWGDMTLCLLSSVFGPISLFVWFAAFNKRGVKHGLKFK